LIKKGKGKTGRDIKGMWDPIRGRYVYDREEPLANPEDFIADRPSNKETLAVEARAKDRASDSAYDPKQADVETKIQEFLGMEHPPPGIKPEGLPIAQQEKVEERWRQQKEEREASGVESTEDAPSQSEVIEMLQQLVDKYKKQGGEKDIVEQLATRHKEDGPEPESKSMKILNKYLKS
jgi:hypothetical protein